MTDDHRHQNSDVQFVESILHPTDFSPGSERAFAHALAIALKRRSELTLLHAGPDKDGEDWQRFPAVRDTLKRWGLLAPDAPRSAVVSELGVQVRKIQTRTANPARAIRQYLVDSPTELLVLATEGREGLARWLRPSAAESIASRSSTLTLFVSQAAGGFVGAEDGTVSLRRVLIPIADKPSPRRAMVYAARAANLLENSALEITLLHVGEANEVPAITPPDHPACTWQTLTRQGDVVEVILEVAAEKKVDLIAMATRGQDGILDALRGSVTQRVLRRAPCPLLAVPE